jgi:hypothetical protein
MVYMTSQGRCFVEGGREATCGTFVETGTALKISGGTLAQLYAGLLALPEFPFRSYGA